MRTNSYESDYWEEVYERENNLMSQEELDDMETMWRDEKKPENYKLDNVDNARVNGKRVKRDECGNIRAVGYYRRGNLNGVCTQFYEDGRLQSRIEYKDGVKDGMHEEWDEHLNQTYRCRYRAGKAVGMLHVVDVRPNRWGELTIYYYDSRNYRGRGTRCEWKLGMLDFDYFIGADADEIRGWVKDDISNLIDYANEQDTDTSGEAEAVDNAGFLYEELMDYYRIKLEAAEERAREREKEEKKEE